MCQDSLVGLGAPERTSRSWRGSALLRHRDRGAAPILLSDLVRVHILLSDLVRVHPGRPAALPTATGWDEELRAWTSGLRLPRPGHSDPYVRSCSATGTDRERSDLSISQETISDIVNSCAGCIEVIGGLSKGSAATFWTT